MYKQKKLAPVLTKTLYCSENSGEQSGLFICFQVPFINHWLLKSVHLPVCFKGDSTNNFTAPNQLGTQRDNHVITTLQVKIHSWIWIQMVELFPHHSQQGAMMSLCQWIKVLVKASLRERILKHPILYFQRLFFIESLIISKNKLWFLPEVQRTRELASSVRSLKVDQRSELDGQSSTMALSDIVSINGYPNSYWMFQLPCGLAWPDSYFANLLLPPPSTNKIECEASEEPGGCLPLSFWKGYKIPHPFVFPASHYLNFWWLQTIERSPFNEVEVFDLICWPYLGPGNFRI
ncbi:hypothetical protein C8J56DRAFT_890103 [Mycena floridula]|nr:hypothetical protein C8J56DRAFT_890103 [Mycena floridula]